MIAYLEAYNGRNSWARRERILSMRRVRKDIKKNISKAEQKIDDLMDQIEAKLSPEAFDNWESEYYNFLDDAHFSQLETVHGWLMTQEPIFTTGEQQYASDITKYTEEMNHIGDKKFKNFLVNVVKKFKPMHDYYQNAVKIIYAAIQKVEDELGSSIYANKVRSHAQKPKDLKSLKELIEAEQTWAGGMPQIQPGFFDTEKDQKNQKDQKDQKDQNKPLNPLNGKQRPVKGLK